MPEINTIEEARAEIVRLSDALTAMTNERDTLSQNNETLTQDNERLSRLNQTYFNRIMAQDSNQAGEPEEETEVPTCEEYARTLTDF